MKKRKEEKIKFKDLSGWMKVATIGGMVVFFDYLLSFLWNLFVGFYGA